MLNTDRTVSLTLDSPARARCTTSRSDTSRASCPSTASIPLTLTVPIHAKGPLATNDEMEASRSAEDPVSSRPSRFKSSRLNSTRWFTL